MFKSRVDHYHHYEDHLVSSELQKLKEFIEKQTRAILLQNEAILAKLEGRGTRLSEEDQKRLNEIFDIEASDTAKIDTELENK